MSAGLRAKTSLSLTVTRPFQILKAASMGCGLGTRRGLGASSTAQRSMSASEARAISRSAMNVSRMNFSTPNSPPGSSR